MVNESEIIVTVINLGVCKKKRVLGEEERRTNLGGRKSVETYHKCKSLPNMFLFIARVL